MLTFHKSLDHRCQRVHWLRPSAPAFEAGSAGYRAIAAVRRQAAIAYTKASLLYLNNKQESVVIENITVHGGFDEGLRDVAKIVY